MLKPFGLGLLATLGVLGSATSVSCGKGSSSGGETGSSGGSRSLRVGTREFTSQEPGSGTSPGTSQEPPLSEDGTAVVWNPPADVTPPPPWEPTDAYNAFKTHCFDCHYQFRYKESVLGTRVKIQGAILANGSAKPMPPYSRSPNYTTFRNTTDGQAILAWLAEATATPAATATPVATSTPSDSPYKWDGVNGQDRMRDIVQASCVSGCHVSGGTAPSYLVLDSLTAFKSHVFDARYQVENGTMPKAPRTISASDKAKLLDYLNHSSELR